MEDTKRQAGSYKNKKNTIEDLNKAIDISDKTPAVNPVDQASKAIEAEQESYHGITDRIRNIFND